MAFLLVIITPYNNPSKNPSKAAIMASIILSIPTIFSPPCAKVFQSKQNEFKSRLVYNVIAFLHCYDDFNISFFKFQRHKQRHKGKVPLCPVSCFSVFLLSYISTVIFLSSGSQSTSNPKASAKNLKGIMVLS